MCPLCAKNLNIRHISFCPLTVVHKVAWFKFVVND